MLDSSKRPGGLNGIGLPPWLVPTVLTLLLFGAWAVVPKAMGPFLSSSEQQAYSTLGFLPVMAILALSRSRWTGTNRVRGKAYALLAGVFLALGNIAYYYALSKGGAVSTLAP